MSDDRAPIDLGYAEAYLREDHGPICLTDDDDPRNIVRALIAECRRLRAKIERVRQSIDGDLPVPFYGTATQFADGAARVRSQVRAALTDTEPNNADGSTDA